MDSLPARPELGAILPARRQPAAAQADAEIDRLRDQLHRLFGEIDRLKEQNQLLQAERDELVRHEERRVNELQTMLNGYTAMEQSIKQAATLKQRGET
jgi:TolA-binding protein